MENMFRKSTVLLFSVVCLLVSTESIGNDFSIKVIGSRYFEWSPKNIQGKAMVTISDDAKTVVYRERMEASTVRRVFDLSNMPKGRYEFVFEDDFKIESTSFEISDDLTFDLSNSSIQFVPTITKMHSYVNVGLLSETRTSATITVYNEDDVRMVHETVTGEGYFGKRLNFDKAFSGVYRVVIQYNGKSFVKKIRI